MKSVCFAYSHSLRTDEAATAVLKNDFVVCTAGEWAKGVDLLGPRLQLLLEPKLFRYCDVWGASYHSVVDLPGGVPAWFPGPGDAWPIPRSDEGKAHAYYRGELFEAQFWNWFYALMRRYPHQAGIFVDDFRPEIRYWGLSPATMAMLQFLSEVEEESRLERIETSIRAMAAKQRPRAQEVCVNGTGLMNPTKGPRLHESIGKWTRLDDKLIGEGDWLLVKGLRPDGSWAKTLPSREDTGGYPGGTDFKTVFRHALELASKLDLVVGLCYETPPEGQSQCSVHPYTDPKTWESI